MAKLKIQKQKSIPPSNGLEMDRNFIFAAVGDTHGHMHAMVRLLAGREQRLNKALAFVLQVGDFEPHRHETDLATMAAPTKYKKLGDFSSYARGASAFPWPIYFIGGNHEPYGFLDANPQGFELVHNCHYLGRVGLVEQYGLRIAGVSGIYREDVFKQPRPDAADIEKISNKQFAYFNEQDIDQALALDPVDILMLHDWPSNIIAPADAGQFEQQRRSVTYHEVGNGYARFLVDTLRPKLVLCGHMHKPYRTSIQHPTGEISQICCLASVEQGKESIAVFASSANAIREVTISSEQR